MKAIVFVLFLAAASVSACADGKPEELRQLETMDLEQARVKFQALPPETQVRVVAWELEHRRPSSSRFDYLLDHNGAGVGPLLLVEAIRTDNFNVNVTLLLEFADLQQLPNPDGDGRLSAAIARCYELGGQGNRECEDLHLKLAPDSTP